jgi:hypothetical protein
MIFLLLFISLPKKRNKEGLCCNRDWGCKGLSRRLAAYNTRKVTTLGVLGEKPVRKASTIGGWNDDIRNSDSVLQRTKRGRDNVSMECFGHFPMDLAE